MNDTDQLACPVCHGARKLDTSLGVVTCYLCEGDGVDPCRECGDCGRPLWKCTCNPGEHG
jgi:hypothetical protein